MNQPYDDEIDLAQLWQTLVDSKGFIALMTTLSTAVAVVVSLLMTPVFRSEVLLQPVTEKSGGLSGLSESLGGLGGLAALAGVSLPGAGGGNKSVSIATLKSRILTDQFIEEKKLLPVLFYRKWNEDEQRWSSDDIEKIPDLWDAYKLFDKKIRKVTEDKKSGLVILSIEWKNREQAAEWANDLVRRANIYLREKALEESQRNLAYLEEQAQQTRIVEVRESIFKLMESEMKKVMLAKGTEEYAFKIVDPATVPKKKIRPQRALIAALGLFAGLFGSGFWVLLRNSFKSKTVKI